MAATALRTLALLVTLTGLLPAQLSRAVNRQVTGVAMALTAGNPSEAITPFDKSFSAYEQLRDYFAALTNSYTIVNELEITDETIANGQASVQIHWIMTLSDPQTALTETREADVVIKLSLKKYVWRIVDFAPIELFNPAPRRSK